MKRMTHYALSALASLLAFMLAAPKAIGLTMLYYSDSMPKSQFGDGGPADIKELHEAMDKAIKQINENVQKTQDMAMKALETSRGEGTIHKEQNDKLTELGTKGQELGTKLSTLQQQLLDVEQKLAQRRSNDVEAPKTMYELIEQSEQWKANVARGAGAKTLDPITVGSFHKTQIVNAPTTSQQPLVVADRVAGLIVPPEQRLFMRDLIPSARTTSNLVEFASEATFTNNAGPQGGGSPVQGEGELKPESAMTFTLASAPVITLAHWIPASRQVLSDALMLAGHINSRLSYGLKLEEEQELLTGAGVGGELYGLITQSTAFSHGITNQTALDTYLKAFLQVSLSNFEASGLVLHPIDWAAAVLLKDTTGQYLFSNPQDVTAPRVWGKPVVATQTMNLGKFLAGAFNLCAQIWDREDATIRVSENVNDHFIRNLVAILAEERLALTVYRPSALVYGTISQAG